MVFWYNSVSGFSRWEFVEIKILSPTMKDSFLDRRVSQLR